MKKSFSKNDKVLVNGKGSFGTAYKNKQGIVTSTEQMTTLKREMVIVEFENGIRDIFNKRALTKIQDN